MVVPGKHESFENLDKTIEWMSCSKTTDMSVKVIFTKFSAREFYPRSQQPP
jgi:hypothetical protein